MRETITLGGIPVDLDANGGTPIRYKMLFGKDIMKELANIKDAKENYDEFIDILSRVAYVMNAQAKKEANLMTYEGFIEFCEQFEDPFVFVQEAEKIINIYFKNLKTTSESKNIQGPQSEK